MTTPYQCTTEFYNFFFRCFSLNYVDFDFEYLIKKQFESNLIPTVYATLHTQCPVCEWLHDGSGLDR